MKVKIKSWSVNKQSRYIEGEKCFEWYKNFIGKEFEVYGEDDWIHGGFGLSEEINNTVLRVNVIDVLGMEEAVDYNWKVLKRDCELIEK